MVRRRLTWYMKLEQAKRYGADRSRSCDHDWRAPAIGMIDEIWKVI